MYITESVCKYGDFIQSGFIKAANCAADQLSKFHEKNQYHEVSQIGL
jgi:hypothetical protein